MSGELRRVERFIHEPHCNAWCIPGGHHLSNGVGMPHLHRTDLDGACGKCVSPERAHERGDCWCGDHHEYGDFL